MRENKNKTTGKEKKKETRKKNKSRVEEKDKEINQIIRTETKRTKTK